jgi:hypothetical protein
MLSMTTLTPFAKWISADFVHHVRWWGGAFIKKFGMRVIAEGTCGTPTIISPPGLTACTI